jgi:hypothetical protein
MVGETPGGPSGGNASLSSVSICSCRAVVPPRAFDTLYLRSRYGCRRTPMGPIRSDKAIFTDVFWTGQMVGAAVSNQTRSPPG